MTSPARAVHTLATTTHGRYLVRSTTQAHPSGVVVGFHGYGQNAQVFLDDVEKVPGVTAWTVVAVQGLHRFYARSGDVVASWMTSEDRELAIADNIAYVRAVVARIETAGPIVFAGFSQGVATAFRAIAHVPGGAGLIALGGDIPPDVRAAASRLPPVLLARGSDDEWYKRETYESDVAWLEARGVDLTRCDFTGGHEWSAEFLEAAAEFLSARAGERPRGY